MFIPPSVCRTIVYLIICVALENLGINVHIFFIDFVCQWLCQKHLQLLVTEFPNVVVLILKNEDSGCCNITVFYTVSVTSPQYQE